MAAEVTRTRPSGDHWLLWAVRAGHVAMWGALALGVVGGLWALAGPRTDPAVTVTSPPPAAPDVAAGGWAELYVAAWLGGGSDAPDSISTFYPEPVDWGRVEAGRRSAARTAAVQIRELSDGYWSVTIAAEIIEAPGDQDGRQQYVLGGVRFFQVGVIAGRGGFVATGLPGEVAAPQRLPAPASLVKPPTRGGFDDPDVTATVEGFVTALLTDGGDLSRYVTSDAAVVPVRPAPYATTAVAGLSGLGSDEGHLLIRALVVGSDPQGEALGVSEYVLRLARRDGRWEVAELLPAPPLEYEETDERKIT